MKPMTPEAPRGDGLALPSSRFGLLLAALFLGACESNPAQSAPDAAPRADLRADSRPATDASREAAPAPNRTMLRRRLFGATHPHNLLIDPAFGIRGSGRGLGSWLAISGDPSTGTATMSASYLNDSPNGMGLPVARLSDNSKSTSHYNLDLIAQVAGGPGPFNLRVWVSTLDAATSAKVTGVHVGVLTSIANGQVIDIDEDTKKARVIAGRTWHCFAGTFPKSLSLGGYVLVDFAPSANTWLLQAPEFVPKLIDPAATAEISLPIAKARAMTARERELIIRYKKQPLISVPGGHPVLQDQPEEIHRR